uniref:Uncharacterized protein n=1 Tax=Cacopsylla melanoneura TaxID=428564 RepID=A0A8D8R0I8_9HEMI
MQRSVVREYKLCQRFPRLTYYTSQVIRTLVPNIIELLNRVKFGRCYSRHSFVKAFVARDNVLTDNRVLIAWNPPYRQGKCTEDNFPDQQGVRLLLMVCV